MADEESDNQDISAQQMPQSAPAAGGEKKSRALWAVLLVFLGFVLIVFLTEREDMISWVEDYDAGIKLAKQQNKPVLLAFYKLNTRFSTDTLENTYTDPKVIKYVEANFIPVLIDVDKQPKIAERYEVSYYPTHYIKRPDSDKLFGPMLGYDPPAVFIEKLKGLFEEMKASGR
jgi:hypothetical protein